MIILHITASQTGLNLWAEGHEFDAKAARTGHHPFALPASLLRRHLQGSGLKFRDPICRDDRMTRVILPSAADQPLPSTPRTGLELPKGPYGYTPWRLEAVRPDPREASELARAHRNRDRLPQYIELGPDAEFWTHAIEMGLRLAQLGRYAPTIERDENQTYARWQPVIAGEDLDAFNSIAAAMPSCARAAEAYTDDARTMSPPDAREALRTAIDILVDETVREAVAPDTPATRRGANNEHDDLMRALTRPKQRSLTGTTLRNAQLRAQILAWRETLDSQDEAPVVLCLRLEPPDAAADDTTEEYDWFLRYLLQAKHDPTLMADAQSIWAGDDRTIRPQPGFNPRRTLQNELTKATRLSNFLPDYGDQTGVPGVHMNVHQAHEFIAQDAELLQAAGVTVLLPERWNEEEDGPLRITGTARISNDNTGSTGVANLAAIMEFDWTATIGDDKITPRQMERLAAAKAPLVRLGNRWVDSSAQNVRDAVRRWQKRPRDGTTARELLPVMLDSDDEEQEIHAAEWLEDLGERLRGDKPIDPCPDAPGLNGELRPYQARGYGWLRWLSEWGLGACLADDMGLGKTLQSLALLLALPEQPGQPRPDLLVVCPTTLIANWRREAERFAPSLGVAVHHGPSRAKYQDGINKYGADKSLLITTYGTLQRDHELLAARNWRAVILDEAQNIKNPDTRQARAAAKLRSPCRIALTGTPVENSVGDLWSIMDFLNPGLLGNRTDFRKNFNLPITKRNDQKAIQSLHKLTAPFVLRRMKTDPEIAPDLPEKTETTVPCNLTREQASLYQATLKGLEEKLASTEGIERLGLVFSVTTRLKQICDHPELVVRQSRTRAAKRSGKLARLLELIDEVARSGQQALIFTQFVQMGHILTEQIAQATSTTVPFLYGATRPAQRDEMVQRFQNTSETPIMIVSLKAGGNGLNLTAATHVFHYDRWWNPAVENQASDRAFRIGQTQNVQVHKMTCTGTLEEKIGLMIEQKTELAERLVQPGDQWLANLSDSELREVLTLTTTT